MTELKLEEIARLVGGALQGPGERAIRGVSTLESAGPEDLSFIANPRYLAYLEGSRAAAVLVSPGLSNRVPQRFARITVDDPHVALYRVLSRLHPAEPVAGGVDSTAAVDPAARVDPSASIGPFAVVGRGVEIGPRTRVGAHVVLGAGARLGADTVLHPHVTLYDGVRVGDRCVVHSGARLGREGFGFVWVDGGHRKVPQVGGCVVEDDVEIGNNVTVDRGSVGDTVIGAGTKIDSLVHLGHNVRIGRHVFLVAQVGIAGSTRVGDGAVLGGQVGVGGHLEIGPGARIGAQGGVTADVPAGETYSGYPARPHREALRAQGSVFRLPDLVKRVRALEKAIFGGRD